MEDGLSNDVNGICVCKGPGSWGGGGGVNVREGDSGRDGGNFTY